MEKSFGIIPLRKEKDVWQVFLVKLKSGNHWGFPKGHQEKETEEPKEIAQRELKEETNLEVVKYLSEISLEELYTVKKEDEKKSKKVKYFLAEVMGKEQIQDEEILEGKWVDLEEAVKTITYEESKKICKQVKSLLKQA